MVMARGLRPGLILFSAVLLYATAVRAAGMMVCLPPERTVCAVSRQVTFPAQVDGTDLKILNTVRYEGAFLENGGDTPVVDALGILLENTGDRHIRTAWVMLTGAGETRMFLARDLPPGSRAILLEIGGAAWTDQPFDSVAGGAQTGEEDLLAAGWLEIREVDMGAVAVTNLTEGTLLDLELTYKNYLSDGDVYQGGIAYRCRIPTLHPGQTYILTPSHYAAGYSRFVYAQQTP